MHYTVRLTTYTCYQFVIRRLSFFTETISLILQKKTEKKIQQNNIWKSSDSSERYYFEFPATTRICIRLNKLPRVTLIKRWPYTSIYVYPFFQEYGESLNPRKTAHAQSKYQDSSTTGRGARASYRTMLPEISARRSLL